jgi:xanthine phosphoribosyltransferase
VKLAQTAGATIVGIGALIEKVFEGGRKSLEHLDIPIVSLAAISSMAGDEILFESGDVYKG